MNPKQTPGTRKLTPMQRELARRRAVGDTVPKIAEDLGVSLSWAKHVAARPEVQAQVAQLLDMMDAELVRSQVYAPYLLLLAGGKRRRRALKPAP